MIRSGQSHRGRRSPLGIDTDKNLFYGSLDPFAIDCIVRKPKVATTKNRRTTFAMRSAHRRVRLATSGTNASASFLCRPYTLHAIENNTLGAIPIQFPIAFLLQMPHSAVCGVFAVDFYVSLNSCWLCEFRIVVWPGQQKEPACSKAAHPSRIGVNAGGCAMVAPQTAWCCSQCVRAPLASAGPMCVIVPKSTECQLIEMLVCCYDCSIVSISTKSERIERAHRPNPSNISGSHAMAHHNHHIRCALLGTTVSFHYISPYLATVQYAFACFPLAGRLWGSIFSAPPSTCLPLECF